MYRLKLLTFDVTNTILKVKVSPAHQYSEAAKVFGIRIPESQIEKVYRSTWKKKRLDHPNYGHGIGMTSKEWWQDFVHRVFVNAGYTEDPNDLRKVTDLLWNRFEEATNWEVLPDSRDILSSLKDSGIRLGVVSNFDERLEKTLAVHNLQKYFDFIVTSVSARAEKPDPAIFLHALKLSGIDARDAGHVGDDVFHDYVPAKKVGMTAFLVRREDGMSEEILKHVHQKDIIKNLMELENKLQK